MSVTAKSRPRWSPSIQLPTDRELRAVFGSFTTGVTVVTCSRPDKGPFGVTISSFTAVSLDPPLVLICMKRNGSSRRIIAEAATFAINVLQQHQHGAAAVFSGLADGVDQICWGLTRSGIPVLDDSLGLIECEVDQVHQVGDHDIITCRVLGVSLEGDLEPLVYYRGNFRSLVNEQLPRTQEQNDS